MADPEAVERARQGADAWNRWKRGPDAPRLVDLAGADLAGVSLTGADLTEVDLERADLSRADLSGCTGEAVKLVRTDLTQAVLADSFLPRLDLSRAVLVGADLSRASLTAGLLRKTRLSKAKLSGANLANAYLLAADLREADLRGVILHDAIIRGTHLTGADLTGAEAGGTTFASVDLRGVRGLAAVVHSSPSPIAIDTLYRSAGEIPDSFLRGCGVPDDLIAYFQSFVGAEQANRFYSVFISYSSADEVFARRLHERLQAEHLRVWFAPENMQGGKKLDEQIDHAIELHDRLLVVLSEHSLASAWVLREIRRARTREQKEGRRVLFPIRLMSFEAMRDWESFDADLVTDLGGALRSYYVPDFTAWRDHNAFEAVFSRLLRDLRAEES
jgi:hypothetical protein